MTSTPLPAKDRLILTFLGFFVLCALTLECWWLWHTPTEMIALRRTSFFAHLFDIYGAADRAYFEERSFFAHGLEAINVYFTQVLNLALAWAIWKRSPWRHPLQLLIGAYLSYSVILYFLVAHLSGYAAMRYRSAYTLALFYGANAPWLLAHLYLVWDSALAIRARFGYRESASASEPRGSAWADVNDARSTL